MDSKHFDTIVKSFGKDASRRGVLRGVTATALGALGLGLGRVASAAPECRNNNDCATVLGSSCSAPCGAPVCERGNAGFGGGGNTCRCASPCEGTSRPVCEVFRGQARCRRA